MEARPGATKSSEEFSSMSRQNAQAARDQLLILSDLALQFAGVHRTMIYPDGHYENDSEHSFHLALCASEIAANFHPELDVGLVSQFSIVHDLPEIYAGDVPSYKRTEAAGTQKEKAEKIALERLYEELPPHSAALLKRYEDQREPEARFVRLIDKLLPPAIHAVAPEVNKEDFFSRFNIKTIEDVNAANKLFFDKLQAMFPEFDFILLVRQVVEQTSRDIFFADSSKNNDG